MREVWTLNLENVPDKVPPLPADAVVSACAWSDDGLVAFASSASSAAGNASKWGYTSTPSIFVVHVDHPERHSQLSGGHEHDIAHLSWVHRQMGTVLMSADERSCICLWKPVQGLINRWELHHRLQFGPVKLAQFLNQPPTFQLPPPYFPENEALLKGYHAVVNAPRPATIPANTPRDVYDSKYRKDVVPKAAAVETPAAKAAEKKSLRNMPGCLCLLALSSYGEARVFVELAAGPSGVEWSSASARLSSHELPDSSSRSTSRASAASDSSSNQAVLCVEQATITTRNGLLYLAVAEESQIMFFTLKCTYWPLKVTATPHTRIQLKSDIKLQAINAPNPILSPSLIHMGFNPTKPEDFIVVYRMGGGVEVGEKARGGQQRLERMRLKDKPPPQVPAQPTPQGAAKPATTPASSDVESLHWMADQRQDLSDSSASAAAGEETVVTHTTMTNDGQFLVLAYASGKVQLRMLDTLQEAPPAAYLVSLGEGAAEGHTWGTVVSSCCAASGNCMLLLDSRGRAKVVEMAHTWSMDSAATAASIANHFVHQLEICLCKSCENWDVILALGGVLRSHPQAMTILETLLKQLRDNYTLLPDSQKRLYRQAYEMVLLQLLPLSQHQQHLLQWRSLEARLLLFYLLDCFRFAQPFVNQRSPAVGAAGTAQGLAEAGASRMRMQCGDMMLTMGQSIVALTVWNLHQSTKAFEYDKTRAAQPPDAAGRGGSQYRHFVLDIEQLTWTKDLLKYYQTRLQERLGGPNAPGAPTAAPAGAGAGADSNGVHVGAPPPPTSTAAPVAAPPPVMAPPPIEETVEAPLAPGSDVLESKMHNSTDGTDGSKDTRNQGHEDGSKDARNRLPYGVADVKYLIDMVEFVLEAHKAKNDYNAPAQAGAAAAAADLQEAKTRIFWQKMAENKVDPEYGLPARLKHGTFALSEFQHAALELYLSLNAHPQGFLARACGYWHMELEHGAAAAAETPRTIRPFGPLPLQRSLATYAREEMSAGTARGEQSAGTKRHPDRAPQREFDVLKRARVRADMVRQCCSTGRVTSVQPDNALYHRWIYACPFSGGKWRAALDYDWHLDAAAALANAPSDQVA